MTAQSFTPQRPAFPALHLVDEINHRVLNEYSEVVLALSTVAERAAGAAQDAIYWAISRLLAHADAHRALQPPAVEGLVNLGDHIGQVCESLSNATLAENGVHVTLDTEEIWLDAGQCWRIGLIVAELIRNAARHGLSGGAGDIEVRIAAEASGAVSCLVSDAGGARAPGSAGRGLRVVRAIADELGGAIAAPFGRLGSAVCLRIPAMAATH